jgi:hypothetical protein
MLAGAIGAIQRERHCLKQIPVTLTHSALIPAYMPVKEMAPSQAWDPPSLKGGGWPRRGPGGVITRQEAPTRPR